MTQAPPAPQTVEETGIERELLQGLVAKTLYTFGTMTPSQIAAEIKLPVGVVNSLIKDLQRLLYVEARGLAGDDIRGELRYAIGGAGNQFTAAALAQSQYVGPAPVSYQSYVDMIRSQAIANERLSRENLKSHMAHLVFPEPLIDTLGPAFNSARSVLLYGEPGNGKTSIAEACGNAFQDTIFVPFCFEIGGQIINLFDPTIHRPVDQTGALEEGVEGGASRRSKDSRWMACRRPFVLTGGELTLDMLDLSFNSISKYYEAPVHIKAMNGVFIVDDFGRQRTDPQSVLNRWIVPLERRYDFLTLHTGKKFSLPFDQLAVFSTNLDPEQLADAGGLRRLYYKIRVPTPTAEDYRLIFIDAARDRGIPFEEAVFSEFFENYYRQPKIAPAGHHPKYLIDFVISTCNFRGEEPHLSMGVLEQAWGNMTVS
ncbi:AAA family ATPase [Oricola cellulosilytica]|uniref:AAA family ATPase n=1 Tax=Oricola cellulosilytica TaxID=1429082 RepID=A0A4R0PHB1_9HYPH|nr:AAA family ATPase [Oricola cellulosilytica]TCD16174.1 AAA family ATPase [Oricola cellulosilytica]